MKHHRDYEDRFSGPGIMPDHFGTNDWEDADITGEDPRVAMRRELSPSSPVWSVGIKALAAAAVIILAALLIWPVEGRAHDAKPTASQPLGWAYDYGCCSSIDCYELSDGAVEESSNGFTIRATGEFIASDDPRIKRSKDEFYHQCTPLGKRDALRSICLYVPDRGI